EGRLPETVPLGGAGSGFLRLWLVPSLAGVVGNGRGHRQWAEATNAVVERRQARRPDRKGTSRRLASVFPRASQARNGCLASTQRLPALRSPFGGAARETTARAERRKTNGRRS